MSETNFAFVATSEKPQLPPPQGTTGAVGWVRENLFSSPLNTILTLLSLFVVYSTIPGVVNWAFVNSVWNANSLDECRALTENGACWAVIRERYHQFLFGFYPSELTGVLFLHLACCLWRLFQLFGMVCRSGAWR